MLAEVADSSSNRSVLSGRYRWYPGGDRSSVSSTSWVVVASAVASGAPPRRRRSLRVRAGAAMVGSAGRAGSRTVGGSGGSASVAGAPRSRSLRRRTATTSARAAASASATAASVMPSRPANGISPSPPPATQASMSSVSECANALARTPSGTRSWITASTASFASPLPIAVSRHSTATVSSEYRSAANAAAAAVTVIAPACRTAGRWIRIVVPTAVARNEPIASAPATSPIAVVAGSRTPGSPTGLWCARMLNARNSARKPYSPRRVALPARLATTRRPDSTLAPLCPGSWNSRGSVSGGCESARPGSRRAITMPATNTTMATRSVHCGPNWNASAPTGAATAPARVPNTEARAPASDSPSPAGSTRGTAALRATPYARDRTSIPNAAGYTVKPPMCSPMA